MNDDWHPQAGDLLWVDLSPTSGTEQSGRRPVLVISSDPFNQTTNRVIVLPTTSRMRGWATEVSYETDDSISGVILCDQIRTIDWRARFARKAGRVRDNTLLDVRRKLAIIIGAD